eukprot:gene2744-4152_t
MGKTKKNQKKKNFDDEEDEEPKMDVVAEEENEDFSKSAQNKKKNKKNKKKKDESDDDEEEAKLKQLEKKLQDEQLEDDEWEVHTKKPKKNRKNKGIVDEDSDDDEEEEEFKPQVIEQPKKNKKKKKEAVKNTFAALDDDDEDDLNDEDLEEELRRLEAELAEAELDDEDLEDSEDEEEKKRKEEEEKKKKQKKELTDEEKKQKKKEEQKRKKEKEKAEKLKKQQEEEARKKKQEKKNPKKKDEKKEAPKKLNPKLEALKAEQEAKKKAEEEAKRRAEEERKRLEEQIKLAEEERRRQEAQKLKEKKEKLEAIKLQKKKGTFMTKKQKEQQKANEHKIEMLKKQGLVAALVEDTNKPKPKGKPKKPKKEETKQEKKEEKVEKEESDDDMGWEDLDSEEEEAEKKEEKVEEVKEIVKEETKEEQLKKELRSPICVVLGHVDTGKTKILDKIRRTNVQDGEAGGITQQIGATFVPMYAIEKQTASLNELYKLKLKIPGLLIIDTPGHESFTNLRTRGSSLCDIAILVVDILHGLENQTLESLQLLRQRKTPFVVALNKVDTCTEWISHPNTPIQDSLKEQPSSAIQHFEERVKHTIGLFQLQGINSNLYYKNKDMKNTLNLVPTSAITGEGLPDLLMLMTQLTQKHMAEKIKVQKNDFQCTLLEVKVIPGLGTTIDVILTQGKLREKDKIVICTLNGAVVTNIRALLTPQPMKELRVKGEYVHHKEIYAAQGIKIAGQDLDGAIPGSPVLLVTNEEDIDDLKDEVMKDLESLLSHMSKVDRGVCVQASTLGSLEALLAFLEQSKIPVMGISIGPVHRKDVIKASTMVDSHPEYALILAFDVQITKEANDAKDKFGVKIFDANIIYHLFDKFTAHMKQIKEQKKIESAQKAVFPCSLKIVDCFHNRDPITLGVDVVDGKLKVGTPLCIHYPATKEEDEHILEIGKVASIQEKKIAKQEAGKGASVAIQLSSKNKGLQYGRHFNDQRPIYSKLTRESIDLLKENFFEELQHEDKLLIQQLKKTFGISNPMRAK